MQDVLRILKKIGAVITDDHFVYTSGKHGSVYIRKDKLYPNTHFTSKVCRMVAKQLVDKDIDVVVGPAVGGIVLSQWTAYHLSQLKKREVVSVFTEKDYGGDEFYDRSQIFKRGYEKLVQGKKVLVVEDLTNTGASVKKVVDQVKNVGGDVVMTYVLVNRSPETVTSEYMGSPFNSLAVFKAEAYEPGVCPYCQQGLPINTEVGHGSEFLKHLH